MERKTTAKPATVSQTGRPVKKVNPAFIKLQIKTEKTVDEILEWVLERTSEQSFNSQTKETLLSYQALIETFHLSGLLSSDRQELPEKE